jgi:hypothetical protein
MSRRDARPELDLFTLPERTTERAPLPSRPVLLPDDLLSCLRQLADADLERLRSAVLNEVTRRGPPTPPFGRASDPSDERERRIRTSTAPRPRNSPSVPVAPAVTAGKANAIRAAFRAGLKPATIRPSVRRAAVRRPTSPARGGQVVAAFTMVGIVTGMSISRLDRTAATLQTERARVHQRKPCTPALPRSR